MKKGVFEQIADVVMEEDEGDRSRSGRARSVTSFDGHTGSVRYHARRLGNMSEGSLRERFRSRNKTAIRWTVQEACSYLKGTQTEDVVAARSNPSLQALLLKGLPPPVPAPSSAKLLPFSVSEPKPVELKQELTEPLLPGLKSNPARDRVLSIYRADDKLAHCIYVYESFYPGEYRRLKLGHSQTPFERMKPARTWDPSGGRLLFTVPGTKEIEKRLHDMLDDYRVEFGGTEFFEAPPLAWEILERGLETEIPRLTVCLSAMELRILEEIGEKRGVTPEVVVHGFIKMATETGKSAPARRKGKGKGKGKT